MSIEVRIESVVTNISDCAGGKLYKVQNELLIRPFRIFSYHLLFNSPGGILILYEVPPEVIKRKLPPKPGSPPWPPVKYI